MKVYLCTITTTQIRTNNWVTTNESKSPMAVSYLYSNDNKILILTVQPHAGIIPEQVVNHGIPNEVVQEMVEVSKRFFGMSYEERAKYMSSDLQSPVRYGTSFNQIRDRVFCWRDFLKLNCQPLESVLPFWPSSPADLR